MNPSNVLLPDSDFGMVGALTRGPVTALAEVAGLMRLAIETEPDEDSFWGSIHEKIQERFSPVIRQVVGKLPGVRWVVGHCDGGVLQLFSYVIFSPSDGDDRDPIIIGIAFARRDSAIRITGDVSGEESGHIYFDEGCESLVPEERDAVMAEALRISSTLASQVDVVVRAIEERRAE